MWLEVRTMSYSEMRWTDYSWGKRLINSNCTLLFSKQKSFTSIGQKFKWYFHVHINLFSNLQKSTRIKISVNRKHLQGKTDIFAPVTSNTEQLHSRNFSRKIPPPPPFLLPFREVDANKRTVTMHFTTCYRRYDLATLWEAMSNFSLFIWPHFDLN